MMQKHVCNILFCTCWILNVVSSNATLSLRLFNSCLQLIQLMPPPLPPFFLLFFTPGFCHLCCVRGISSHNWNANLFPALLTVQLLVGVAVLVCEKLDTLWLLFKTACGVHFMFTAKGVGQGNGNWNYFFKRLIQSAWVFLLLFFNHDFVLYPILFVLL